MIYLLHHTLFAAAEMYPDKIAFRCGDEALTYAALAKSARQLAGVLRAQGVQPGDRVGILLHRSLETAVAIYGILRAGGVYVPLNPKAPADYTAFVLQDGGINVLITHPSQRRNLDKLVGARTPVQTIIGEGRHREGFQNLSWADVAAAAPITWTPPRQVETDLAYLIYTSGSTGRPKGIMHSHASGLAFARNAVALYQLGPEDRFANHAPIFFDISQLAYFGAPLVGATAILATDAETIFPRSLSQLIAREKPTVWYSVPLALSQLLNTVAPEDLHLDSLTHIFYAGEPLAPKYARDVLERYPEVVLGNLYGPAETNVCTYYNLPAAPATDAPIPLGTVWQNTDYRIINDQDQVIPPGELGELVIRSTTMMLGYWNDPERTRRAWYHQDLPGQQQRRFYRTGDLVREDEAGNLHFSGRADHQVKVRGYRVELGAIEGQLLTHPDVAEAVAVTLGQGTDALRIVAVVLTKPEVSLTSNDLLAFLRETFPPYAIPESIYLRGELPRTGSGKVDRPGLQQQLAATERTEAE